MQRPLLLVAALGVILRLVHLLAVSSTPILSYHQTFGQSDMYVFDQWAQRIAGGDVLGPGSRAGTTSSPSRPGSTGC